MGQDITEIVKLLFRDGCLLKRINGAFIVLIPKKKKIKTQTTLGRLAYVTSFTKLFLKW